MAIKITNLQQIVDTYKTKDFVYKDLHLDFTKSGNYSEFQQAKIDQNDIAVDYDESAIRNSLKNLLNTKPGQRFLFPTYGLDLHQFVFEPITQPNAQLIGEKIVKAIEIFEPRVYLKECTVDLYPNDNQYEITLVIQYPVFNTIASLNSKLDIRSQSFVFVENSRNK